MPSDADPAATEPSTGRDRPAIRVLIAEPDEVLRLVLNRSLDRPDIAVELTDGSSAGELVAAARACECAVLVAGPGYPATDLLPAIPQLLGAGTRTLVLSGTALDDSSSMLLLAGASGFLLLEEASMSDLDEAVHAVADGHGALHPEVVQAVLERWRSSRSAASSKRSADSADQPDAAAAALTSREREVLVGIRSGLTNRQLATRLGLSEKTVETHKSKLFAKLNARNQAHAVRIADQLRLT